MESLACRVPSVVGHYQQNDCDIQLASEIETFVVLDSLASFNVNPFSPTLFADCGRMSLPKRSAPYWSKPPFFNFYPNVTTLRSGLCYRNSVCRLSVCL